MLNSLILLLLIGLPIRYGIERTKAFWKRDRNPAWVKEFKRLNSDMGDSEKVILLNVSRPIEAMFYSDVIAYKRRPVAQSLLDSLMSEGYSIFYCESKNGFKCHILR